jgi:hypothetical protein
MSIFIGADCDTDHCLVAANVGETLLVSKQAVQKFGMERFNPKKLNDMEHKKQYQLKIANRYAALENLNDYVDVKRAWESITEHIKTSGLKQHMPWFDEECSKL